MRILAIAVASALLVTPVMAQQNNGLNGIIHNLDNALNPNANRPTDNRQYDSRQYDSRQQSTNERYRFNNEGDIRREQARLDDLQRQINDAQRQLNEEKEDFQRARQAYH